MNGQVPISPLTGPIVTNFAMRKVVQYTFLPGVGDGYDCDQGHGTLTSGTMAGQAIKGRVFDGPPGQFDGMGYYRIEIVFFLTLDLLCLPFIQFNKLP